LFVLRQPGIHFTVVTSAQCLASALLHFQRFTGIVCAIFLLPGHLTFDQNILYLIFSQWNLCPSLMVSKALASGNVVTESILQSPGAKRSSIATITVNLRATQ
jgi:hypothetical protein